MRQFSKFLQSLEKEEYNKKYGVRDVRLVGLPEDHYPNTFKTFIYVLGILIVVIGSLVGIYLSQIAQYSIQEGEYYKVWITIAFVTIGIFIIAHYFSVKQEIKDEQMAYRDRIFQQRQIFLKNTTFYQKQEKLFAKKTKLKEFKQQITKYDDFVKNKKQEIEQNKQDRPEKPKKKKKKVKKVQQTDTNA